MYKDNHFYSREELAKHTGLFPGSFLLCQKYGNENWKGKLRDRRGWALHNYDYRQTCRYIYIKLIL